MYELALTKVASFVRLLEAGHAINAKLKSTANVSNRSELLESQTQLYPPQNESESLYTGSSNMPERLVGTIGL